MLENSCNVNRLNDIQHVCELHDDVAVVIVH